MNANYAFRLQPYADAGVIILLGALSSASPDTVIAVNARVWKITPEVGQFFEQYEWDSDELTAQSKKIRGGSLPIGANVIGLSYLKNSGPSWATTATTSEMKAAIADGSVSLCREFETRRGGNDAKVCKDAPRIAMCPNCQ